MKLNEIDQVVLIIRGVDRVCLRLLTYELESNKLESRKRNLHVQAQRSVWRSK